MTETRSPTVSVVIAAFDAAATLRAAVTSALIQQGVAVQVVVVDDGSRDETALVAAEIAREDDRVQVVRQVNAGPGAARNAGLLAGDGELVLFLDADDLLPPDHLRALADVLRRAPQVDLAYGPAESVAEDGVRTPFPIQEDGDAMAESLRGGTDGAFPIHCALVRRAALQRVGGFRAIRPLVEDWDLWTRLAFGGATFRFVSVPPVTYRRGAGTRSTRELEVLLGGLPVLAWAARQPGPHREALRRKLRHRTLAVAGRLAAEGKPGEARRLARDTLRWARRPGEVRESLARILRPGGAG